MKRNTIVITAEDQQRLEALLASEFWRLAGDAQVYEDLARELDRATIVPRAEVPRDVVTMESTVTLRDLDTLETETYTLVYPEQADIASSRLSVLAPIGTAILGYRVGDELTWHVPAGQRRLRIEGVTHPQQRDREQTLESTSL